MMGIDKLLTRRKKTRRRERTTPKTDCFTLLCRKTLGVECVKEYRFHPVRRWRFDYAIPLYRVALEVEGGVWTRGRHTRPIGFLRDMEKYNTATEMGWRVLRTTPRDLLSSSTLKILKNAILSTHSLDGGDINH